MRACRLAGLAALAALSLLALTPAASAAPYDGDWEGSLRCEPAGNQPGIYEPTLASVRGSDMKLLRGAQEQGEVVPGRVSADGSARLSGRTTLADGSMAYINLGGKFAPGSFNATGTAVPEGGGQVRACSVELQPAMVARGEGAPPPTSPPPEDTLPLVVYGTGGGWGYPTWYADDWWWRREMLRRWHHKMWLREQAIRNYCREHPTACGHAAVHPPPHPRPPIHGGAGGGRPGGGGPGDGGPGSPGSGAPGGGTGAGASGKPGTPAVPGAQPQPPGRGPQPTPPADQPKVVVVPPDAPASELGRAKQPRLPEVVAPTPPHRPVPPPALGTSDGAPRDLGTGRRGGATGGLSTIPTPAPATPPAASPSPTPQAVTPVQPSRSPPPRDEPARVPRCSVGKMGAVCN